MSDSLHNFRLVVTVVDGEPSVSLRCAGCTGPTRLIDVTDLRLDSAVGVADAHTTVAHGPKQEPADPWKAATDPINSKGTESLSELSEAAERALRAAASEVLPLLTKWFTKPR